MTIAVTGATGQLGRRVVKTLKTRVQAEHLLALARDPDKAADLGVATRAFDYDQPDGQVRALTNVEVLLLISGGEVGRRVSQHQNVIAAAKAAGVRQLVYISILHANASPLWMAEDHRATESLLRESGLSHTLLRNGWYLENYAEPINDALASGGFIGSAGEGKIAAASRADYAAAAAQVLATEGHADRTYELAGDTAFSMSELAAEVSRQSSKPLSYIDMP